MAYMELIEPRISDQLFVVEQPKNTVFLWAGLSFVVHGKGFVRTGERSSCVLHGS